MTPAMNGYVLSLEEIGPGDLERCGGKAAGLGQLLRFGVRVPGGFCIVGEALDHVVEANGLGGRIAAIAASLDFEDLEGVEKETGKIRALIASAKIPDALEQELRKRYSGLVTESQKYVAVRSSVGVRHSSISSFPGMMDTYHYVLGIDDVLEKVRECWASLWTARAAFARHRKQIPHEHGFIAPVVQLMVHSDMAGVLFTANPINKKTDEIVIESNWGLGESVVSGKSMNDFFTLDKSTLMVKQRRIVEKTVMVTMDDHGSGRTERPVPAEQSKQPSLSSAQLAELGKCGKNIEDHFGFNVDVEWAFQDRILYILQTRKIRSLDEVAQSKKS